MTHSQGFASFTGLRSGARHSAASLWQGTLDTVARVHRAMVSRHQLREMDDRMLADLGISRAQAQFEASRLPWELRPTRR